MNLYILEGTEPRKAISYEESVEFWQKDKGQKGKVDYIEFPDGVRVSTIFLGMDHSMGDGPPLLFETMIFGGEHDQYQRRYTTYEEAQEGHRKAVEIALNS